MSDDIDILTIEDVARQLRCSRAHVYNAIKGKVGNVSRLPAIAIGRRKLVRRAALEQWVRDNEQAYQNGILPSRQESVP